MDPITLLIAGGLVAVAYVAIAEELKEKDRRILAQVPFTAENIEWLARVLIVEQGTPSDLSRAGYSKEWAGIGWVLVNVAATQGMGGEVRRAADRLQSAGTFALTGGPGPPAHRLWSKVLAFARALLEGRVANPIGRRTHWVHIARFKACGSNADCSGKYPVCYQGRCVPVWVAGEGASPTTIGQATFSGLGWGYVPWR